MSASNSRVLRSTLSEGGVINKDEVINKDDVYI